jgi:hypothetical protein
MPTVENIPTANDAGLDKSINGGKVSGDGEPKVLMPIAKISSVGYNISNIKWIYNDMFLAVVT